MKFADVSNDDNFSGDLSRYLMTTTTTQSRAEEQCLSDPVQVFDWVQVSGIGKLKGE